MNILFTEMLPTLLVAGATSGGFFSSIKWHRDQEGLNLKESEGTANVVEEAPQCEELSESSSTKVECMDGKIKCTRKEYEENGDSCDALPAEGKDTKCRFTLKLANQLNIPKDKQKKRKRLSTVSLSALGPMHPRVWQRSLLGRRGGGAAKEACERPRSRSEMRGRGNSHVRSEVHREEERKY